MPRGTTPAPPTNFYPRPPRGGRHRQHLPWRTDQDFYPRPPRGGRRSTPRVRGDAADISIHALREEGDTSRSSRRRWWSYFYPRPPRGGRRFSSAARARSKKFLSTPSARRATQRVFLLCQQLCISIHALREEGDPTGNVLCSSPTVFLSTPSARRATSDGPAYHKGRAYFYPRPPRGGRRLVVEVVFDLIRFLSTPSARRATNRNAVKHGGWSISIHALREEGDSKNRDKISIFKQIIQHSARI